MPKRRRLSASPSWISNRAICDGLEVSIVDFQTGNRLPQLHSSKTRLNARPRPQRYVVFPTIDQKFGIEVKVQPDFDWAEKNALEVLLAFDTGSDVNQKIIYLLKPVPRTLPAVMADDNAVLTMQQDGHSLTRCIDHILVQGAGRDDSHPSVAYFKFAALREDSTVQQHYRRARLPLAKTVSEHQGKIRVEVEAKHVSVNQYRASGLHDVLTKVVRSRKQALLAAGLSLEIVLEMARPTDGVECEGTFRPSAGSRTSPRVTYGFDFFYRAFDTASNVAEPQYLPELLPPPPDTSTQTPSVAQPSTTRLVGRPSWVGTDAAPADLANLFQAPIGSTIRAPMSPSSTQLSLSVCHPSIEPISPGETTVRSTNTPTPSLAGKWDELRDAIDIYGARQQAKREREAQTLVDLRARVDSMTDERRTMMTEIIRLRQDLRRLQVRVEDVDAQLLALHAALSQREEAGDQGRVETVIEGFVSCLRRLEGA